MRETERIRGLRFLRPVEVHIQDHKAMRAYVSSALEQDDLDRTRLRYIALGLLAPELDVRALIEALMEEELVGYYDPRTQSLAIRDDVARAFARASDESADLEWRGTVVHELVHALQDQHLGLGKSLDDQRTTDADNAFGALVEGDATLAMLAYASGLSGVSLEALVRNPRELSNTLRGNPDDLKGAMRTAPPIVRDPLLFRYREGALFAATLAQRGGFRAVDAAHRAPPGSTREILEPAHFLAHEALSAISVPGVELLEAAGHHVVDEDTLGRFELGIYLEGQPLAAPWVADRYVVLRRGDEVGSCWIVNLGHPAAARRAEAAARQARSASGVTVERSGSHLLLTRGLAPTLRRAINARFVRTSAGR